MRFELVNGLIVIVKLVLYLIILIGLLVKINWICKLLNLLIKWFSGLFSNLLLKFIGVINLSLLFGLFCRFCNCVLVWFVSVSIFK